MDKAKAIEVLGDAIVDGGLFNGGWYLAWTIRESNATLDGEFDIDELEAIVWCMRNIF